jgi:hypothetical protein
MTNLPAHVLEVAVFEVGAPASFAPIQRRAHESLATLRGYGEGLRLRGKTEGLFADVIAWDSIDSAQSASKLVREDARFAELMASITKVQLYAHYRLRGDITTLMAELRRAPVVEMACYTVPDRSLELDHLHDRLHELVRAMTGYKGGAAGHQVEDSKGLADLVGWEDAQAHDRAGAELQARPELAPFFSGIGEMKVFELFSVVE